jgi:sialate O-acetylesterase
MRRTEPFISGLVRDGIGLCRMKNVAFLAITILLLCSGPIAHGGVKVPRIFANGMILQQGREIPVWGQAKPGETITVSLAGKSVKVKANDKGYWRAKLPAMKAGGPHTMVVAAGPRDRKSFRSVLIGEVWLCSGQSNMAYPLKGRWRVPKADEVIAAAKFPRIRWTNGYGWTSCSPRTAAKCSAVAFFFARRLHRELDGEIPVGILNLSYSGSSIEQWLPPDKDGKGEGSRFKTRVRPLLRYGIRGAVWYQGESNVARAGEYGAQLKRLITGWRTQWKQGDFPVAVVQLPPYGKYAKQLPTMWTQQMSALELPHTGFIVTTDVGDLKNIHPPRKQEVGERAALWALANVYDKKDLVWSGPIVKAVEFRGDRAVVSFDHAGKGLRTRDGKPPDWFELGGADGDFVKASAKIEGRSVVVRHRSVGKPQAVRFGWHGSAQPNLINEAGLPARPFRTDGGGRHSGGK